MPIVIHLSSSGEGLRLPCLLPTYPILSVCQSQSDDTHALLSMFENKKYNRTMNNSQL